MNDLNPKTRALLGAVKRADDPSYDDFDRVHSRVMAKVSLGAAAGALVAVSARTAVAATSLAPPSVAGSAGVLSAAHVVKLVAMATLLVAAGVGAHAVVTAPSRAAAAPSTVAAAVSLAPSLPPKVTATTGSASRGPTPPSVVPSAPTLPAYPSARSTPRAPSSGGATSRATRPTPSVAQAPITKASARVVVPTAASAALEEEVQILAVARAALGRQDFAGALALVNAHARQFPAGALSEEREALRVYATCAAGQREAGQRLAERFVGTYPGSSHEASVRKSCTAGDSGSGGPWR